MVDAINATNASVVIKSTAEEIHSAFEHAIASTGQPLLIQATQNPLLFFIIGVVLAFALSYIFVLICKTVLKAFTRKTKTDIDDILVERLQHPAAWFIFFLLLSVALVPLSLSNKLAFIAGRVLTSCNIIFVIIIAQRILSTLIMHYGTKIAAKTESTVDDHLLPIVRRFIAVIIWCVGVLIILGVWGVEIAPLIAGAGIAGVAFAFAMQESLKNIFGGVSLAFDRAYGIGDRIKLADGTVGKVHDVSLRSTKIRTFTGDLVVVPNGKIANETFQTYAQPTHETRVLIPFGVAYGTDVEKVKTIALAAVKGASNKIENEKEDMVTKVEFIEMGQFSLNFRLSYWVDDYSTSWDSQVGTVGRLYDLLTKSKVEIPYPTQSIVLKKQN